MAKLEIELARRTVNYTIRGIYYRSVSTWYRSLKILTFKYNGSEKSTANKLEDLIR